MRSRTPPDAIVLRIVAGPDAGRAIAPGPDALVLGRAPGRGRIDDPALEAHHLLVRTRARQVVQLAGRVPARIDGSAAGRGTAIHDGSVLEIGSSRLVVASVDDAPTAVDRGGRRVVLGVGPRSGAHCRIEDATSRTPVAIDLVATRRLLITGPSAAGLVRSLAAQLPPGRLDVCPEPRALLSSPRRGALTVAVDPDPETGWPGGELPPDAAIVGVGATWAATLITPIGCGASAVRRFHAAGRALSAGPAARR